VIDRLVYNDESGSGDGAIVIDSVEVVADVVTIVTQSAAAQAAKICLNTTSAGADVAESVYDFPLLVRLTGDNFNFGEARSDGGDIRCTKPDNTPLPFEIERWDAARRQAEIWIKVDTIVGDDSTQFLVLYWGEAAVAMKRSERPVFDTTDGYRGVWHLAEEMAGAGTNGVYKDATGINDGDDFISATGQSGIIGNGKEFDGTDDYIRVNSLVASYKGADLSISLWVNIRDSGGTIFSKLDSTLVWKIGDESFYFGDGTNTDLFPGVNGAFPSYVGFSDSYAITAQSISSYSWHHLVFTWEWSGDSSGISRYYLDGNEVPLGVSTLIARTGENSNAVLRIGQPNNNESFAFYNGSMDELEIASVVRSAGWIRLAFLSQQERGGGDGALVQIIHP